MGKTDLLPSFILPVFTQWVKRTMPDNNNYYIPLIADAIAHDRRLWLYANMS